MQFQVPQFIDVEDKIFGPLTLKQFIYLAGAAGLCFLAYTVLPFFVAVILIVPLAVLGIALAFYKINNKPFIYIIEAATGYFLRSKLYIWKKQEQKPVPQAEEDTKLIEPLLAPRLSDSKLKDLAWSLDVNEKINQNSR